MQGVHRHQIVTCDSRERSYVSADSHSWCVNAQKVQSIEFAWPGDKGQDALPPYSLLIMKEEQQEGNSQPSPKQTVLFISCPGCNAVLASGSKVCRFLSNRPFQEYLTCIGDV